MTENNTDFSKIVSLGDLGKRGKNFALSVTDEAKPGVAARLKIVAVKKLAGSVCMRATKNTITAEGHIDAVLVRECVASLEEFDEVVGEDFAIEFLRSEPDPESENYDELAEVHDSEEFDVADLLVQQTALAMDQFPRHPEAMSLADEFGTQSESSPFDALSELTRKNQ